METYAFCPSSRTNAHLSVRVFNHFRNHRFGQFSVRGTVTSKTDGQPLPGVSVNVAGTQIGVNTDLEGRYAIDVPDGNSVIEFTFLGMKALKVNVEGRSIIDVTMEEDVGNLDEVVVVAFGTQKRSEEHTSELKSLM